MPKKTNKNLISKKSRILLTILFVIFLSGYFIIYDDLALQKYFNYNDSLDILNQKYDDIDIDINSNNEKEEIILTFTNDTTLSIASWNIQNFGASKSANDEVMGEIAKRLLEYDIIAIQEIVNVNEMVDSDCDRNVDAQRHRNFGVVGNAIRTNLDNLDPNNNYDFIFSEHVFNERYLYVYDDSKVDLLYSYLVNDSNVGQKCQQDRNKVGTIFRDPFVAKFNFNGNNITLMNVHTSPSQNHNELMALRVFFDEIREVEENLLLLGDLNFGCSYYPKFNMFNDSIFIFDDDANTNVAARQCAYDRMIYKEPFIGTVLDWGIDNTITRDISDHYLIWALFGIE